MSCHMLGCEQRRQNWLCQRRSCCRRSHRWTSCRLDWTTRWTSDVTGRMSIMWVLFSHDALALSYCEEVDKCRGTAAAAPPPFRPSEPALCGSCPLVTPYYCGLGDLLCLFCVYPFVYLPYCLCICVFSFRFFPFSFSTLILLVGSFDL